MTASPYIAARARGERRHQNVDYLRSSHWQSTRLVYSESDEPQDCICGETEGLQLHHLHYDSLGDEQSVDLTYLCKRCHAMIHELERRGEIGLDFTGFVSTQRAERYERQVQALTVRREAFERDRRDEMRRRESRSLGAQVRDLMTQALAADVDTTAFVEGVRAQLAALREQLRNS